ncbi:aldo/keto reductase [Spirosoma endbachense]|uniref:Aldo/keto reductase n=1 Tax=Spirosoma endbachense TaxID=2666025 RepID=A0A6P1VNV5_9BACT|nr:aldo/keto reductase [Spirosoma endbachense]QHV94108.1 aldo/keto reductase [Spirosoma endbachense]
MEKRTIGSSELSVAPLAFGGNVFGWTANELTSFQLLDAFVDAGFNLIDTADVYSRWVPGNQGGESETIIGNWLKRSGKRDQVIIATKLGGELAPDKKGLGKDYLKRAVDASLQRLQTDYIDLYQSHYDDLDTPIEETLDGFDKLIKEGKMRVIGASNFTPERLVESLKISEKLGYPIYQSLQPEYNLYDREKYETLYEPIVQQNGISVISYFSLASGFLTGKYRSETDLSKSPRGQGVKKYLNNRGFAILKALDEVAEQYNATPAEVSLAWLMARPGITAPIASATSVDQLHDIAKATEVKLDKSAIDKLTTASAW